MVARFLVQGVSSNLGEVGLRRNTCGARLLGFEFWVLGFA